MDSWTPATLPSDKPSSAGAARPGGCELCTCAALLQLLLPMPKRKKHALGSPITNGAQAQNKGLVTQRIDNGERPQLKKGWVYWDDPKALTTLKTKNKRVSWAVPTPPRSMQDAAKAVKRVGQTCGRHYAASTLERPAA